ncbi:hypothetical protein AVEN_137480-1 [Araneus ventricosus]|uniref:Peptidase A2 domain-containing protein n=1 Tax=Araneus ventricosus TaxID=182803 RepID=A0A4Y2RHS6_ARAVE|nr:hypothetical protein AVEN_137480-1 [Araneus ventricosus]
MLVDTGANVTLVRADLAQKLKENFIYTAPDISLKTATDLEKNEIRTGVPLFSASVEHSKLCSVLVKEKTIIPARSECLIHRVPEASGKFRYVVMDFPSQVSQKSVLVAATLVDLKREAIPVRVLNLDNKPKTVDKGVVIATCEPVVDVVARPQEFSESLRLPLILKGLMENNEQQ